MSKIKIATGLSLSHTPTAATPHRAGPTPNVARDAGRGKNLHVIAAHPSSTAAQLAGAGQGGMGHATKYDGGQPGAPLAHAYGHGVPKERGTARFTPGQRSRVTSTVQDLGRAIKNEPPK